jgi:hypothetical protein
MLVIGGVVSGFASALIGVEACYILDSSTYFISAIIMSTVRGNFLAKNHEIIEKEMKAEGGGSEMKIKRSVINALLNPILSYLRMSKELLQFLFTCGFGALIFLKASGNIIWGAADVLNVSFSHIDGDEAESSRRLGILYR